MTLVGAQLPDPGSPEFPALFGFAIGVLATGIAVALRKPREDVEWLGLMGAFWGGVVGLIVYLAALISDLY